MPSWDIIRLYHDTSTLVIPSNFSDQHWCVAKATYHDGELFLTVYNSILGQDVDLTDTWLPVVLDRVFDDNSVSS